MRRALPLMVALATTLAIATAYGCKSHSETTTGTTTTTSLTDDSTTQQQQPQQERINQQREAARQRELMQMDETTTMKSGHRLSPNATKDGGKPSFSTPSADPASTTQTTGADWHKDEGMPSPDDKQ